MALIQTVHLSMANFKSAPVVPAVQNDSDRQVKMIIDDYTLTSGLTGKIAFERSDGTHYETAAELVLVDNAFVADIDQALTQPGRTMVQLKVTDTLTVSTFSFVIFVEADNSGTVTPQEGIDLVTAVASAEAAADRAESAASTFETDTTLSVSGMAADAKATGQIKSNLMLVREGLQTFYGLGNFQHYGLNADGSFITTQKYRVSNDDPMTFTRDLKISVKDGFRWGYIPFVGTTAGNWSGWITSDFVLPVGTKFVVQIARVTEITSEIADVAEFLNAVTFDTLVQSEINETNDIRNDISRINLLDFDFLKNAKWESGYFNANGNVNSSAHIRTAGFINVADTEIFTLFCDSGYKYYYALYDENKDYISGSITSFTSDPKIVSLSIWQTAKYIRVVLQKTNNTASITDAQYMHSIYTNAFTKASDGAKTINKEFAYTPIEGYYTSSGEIHIPSSDLEESTPVFSVVNAKQIDYYLYYSTSHSAVLSMCSYDKLGNFIERTTPFSATTSKMIGNIQVPENVGYIAFSYRTFGEDVILGIELHYSVSEIAETLKDFPTTVDKIRRNNVQANIGANALRFKPFFSHMFMSESLSGTNVVIPNQSIFDIQIAKRLGFDMIECNAAATSDGHYIALHGSGGKFGLQVAHIDGETDISNIAINSVTLEWIKTNVRYVSNYEKYRVAPLSIEEFLSECKRLCMTAYVTANNSTLVDAVNGILGEDGYIAYNGNRKLVPSAPISEYLGLTTKEAILARCESYGAPYVYAMSNPTDFTDAELSEIIALLHKNGYQIACAATYLNITQVQRLISLGFDCCSSGYEINEIDCGNLCNLSADIDFSDFITTGTVVDNVLTLESGDTIIPNASISSVFIGGGSLHILFSGTITISIAGRSGSFTSDGNKSMWFSTRFLQEIPTFTITATANTEVYSITYRASKM